jgi:hypothetical protein
LRSIKAISLEALDLSKTLSLVGCSRADGVQRWVVCAAKVLLMQQLVARHAQPQALSRSTNHPLHAATR